MKNKEISKETYHRLTEMIGNPDEYLKGKVCSYTMLSRIDNYFLFNLDKDYLKDFFLIKDWVRFSFYNGGLLEDLFKDEIYKEIPLENIQLIWNAFNKNKKEKSKNNYQYFHEKRFRYIPKITSLLVKKARKYEPEKVLPFLKELVLEMKDENKEYAYHIDRNCAKLIGDYLTHTREMNKEIFEYLKEQQNIQNLELHLIFYDWQISKFSNVEKIKIIIDLIKEKRPKTTNEEIIKQALGAKSFHIIKYIASNFNYRFNEEELEKILIFQKSSYNDGNTQFIIENFQPSRLVGRTFSKVYSDRRYSGKIKDKEFYDNNIEYLKRKVSHDELNEKIQINNTENKVKKI